MKFQQQQGISIIGFIMTLAMVIFIAFLGMRIGPMYVEYYSVVNALKGVAAEPGSARFSLYDLRLKVLTRMDLNYVRSVKEHDIKRVRGKGVFLRVAYEVRKPIWGNLDVIATFEKSVRLAN